MVLHSSDSITQAVNYRVAPKTGLGGKFFNPIILNYISALLLIFCPANQRHSRWHRYEGPGLAPGLPKLSFRLSLKLDCRHSSRQFDCGRLIRLSFRPACWPRLLPPPDPDQRNPRASSLTESGSELPHSKSALHQLLIPTNRLANNFTPWTRPTEGRPYLYSLLFGVTCPSGKSLDCLGNDLRSA